MDAPIDPDRVYGLVEAAALLPSLQLGKTVHPQTLRGWAKAKVVRGFRRPGTAGWFFTGAALLEFLRAGQAAEYPGRSPARREKAVGAAAKRAARLGLRVGGE